MNKGRKPKQPLPKTKFNGHAASTLAPIQPKSRRPEPNPRLAMLVTLAIVIFALAGLLVSTTFSDPITALFNGPRGGHGQIVDGIPCDTGEPLPYHTSTHLTIIDNGQRVSIPAGVGTAPGCSYWLQTHDTSGVVDVQAPSQVGFTFTLGQFFDVWGQPLDTRNVAGHTGDVTAYVNQKAFTGDPRTIPLADHASITLEIGTTVSPPPNYDFKSN